jgi:hypothetical protein
MGWQRPARVDDEQHVERSAGDRRQSHRMSDRGFGALRTVRSDQDAREDVSVDPVVIRHQTRSSS